MLSGVSIICFAACYAIALAIEVLGLKVRLPWRRAALVAVAGAGLVAHTLYLAYRADEAGASPLSSPAEWFLLAAWLLALVYVATVLYIPRAAAGLILLPLSLGLIAASLGASPEPFAAEPVSRFWGGLHGSVLLLGTVSVCVGFVAGVMYLLQSYWLKRRRPSTDRLRLPSLEWLETANAHSLAVSAFLVGLGFASGLVLTKLRHQGEQDYVLWTDPVVLSLAAMLLWLVAAELFRIVYPPARRGRKVAYLTLASFLFLVITLTSLTLVGSVHGAAAPDAQAPPLPAGEGRGEGATEHGRPNVARAQGGSPLPSRVAPTPARRQLGTDCGSPGQVSVCAAQEDTRAENVLPFVASRHGHSPEYAGQMAMFDSAECPCHPSTTLLRPARRMGQADQREADSPVVNDDSVGPFTAHPSIIVCNTPSPEPLS